MPLSSDRLAGWLAPKHLVAVVALVADGLLLNFDLRLGLAASTLIAVVVAVWLYIALRYGSLSGTPSVRTALVERSREQEQLRRIAAMRASGAQQGANPADRS